MKYPEPGYSCNDYVTSEDIKQVPNEQFTKFIQATVVNKTNM